jgi:hypothetical protein
MDHFFPSNYAIYALFPKKIKGFHVGFLKKIGSLTLKCWCISFEQYNIRTIHYAIYFSYLDCDFFLKKLNVSI